MSTPRRFAQSPPDLLVLAFSTFVAIGIANALLGVAWPSVRDTFGLPLDALAPFLFSSTAGFVVGSITSGQLSARMGMRPFLSLNNMLAAVGLAGYVIAPTWAIMVALAFVSGWGAGGLDTGLNIYVARKHSVRTMNWMHASFGVGATLGPLIMTWAIASQFGWRAGYAVAAVFHLLLGAAFIVSKRASPQPLLSSYEPLSSSAGGAGSDEPERRAPAMQTLRMPLLWLSVLVFFLYTGVEATAGQWTFTLFTESRGIAVATAGLATSVYWGMLTLGRIVLGAGAERWGIERLLRWSMVGSVFASVLLALGGLWTGLVGFGLLGFALSTIFPTLTSETPRRVGLRHMATAIGLQTGAASIGFAVLPGVAGFVAEGFGLESIGWLLVGTSVAMLVANETAAAMSRRRHRAAAAAD